MFGKNRNKKVGLCVMVVTAALVLATIWAVLATPETALAAPPEGKGKGGGGGGNDPVCFTFSGAGIQSDGGPYCNDKKLKVKAIMTQDGHVDLNLYTETTWDRKFYVDVDFPVGDTISAEGWRFFVGVHDEDFDMRAMETGEEHKRTDVNLMINTKVPEGAPVGAKGESWWLFFYPDSTRWGLDYSASTYVTVTRTAADTWEIEIDDTDLAVLVIQTKVKNKSTFKEYGDEGGVVPVTVPPFTATVTLK